MSTWCAPSSSDHVSEVDLSNPKDLRVVMTGLGERQRRASVTIHSVPANLRPKYKMLVDNFSQCRPMRRVQSIDLQYTRQVVVNPKPAGHGHGKEKIDLSRERRLGEER